jgi:predicted O-methyltransferase YrrM
MKNPTAKAGTLSDCVKRAAEGIVKKMLVLKQIVHKRDYLRRELETCKEPKSPFPPGHFYSPIPSIEEIRRKESIIYGKMPETIPGIDLNEEEQLRLLDEFEAYYRELPFPETKVKHLRYFFQNEAYSYSDAICLYCMIRHAKPQTIIEVGSGYSLCVTLDTNDVFFEGSIKTVFIEPYPELLLSLIKKEDAARINLISKNLQEVELDLFCSLRENDILFIDSTHVGKIDSDVNYIFSKILPILKSGAYIHFHDVFYPFEYPKEWIYEGRAWNEAYVLRAFLQYNKSFEIILFNTFMEHFHRDTFEKNLPLCLKNTGASIWIRKR